jgi:hypothetical protein
MKKNQNILAYLHIIEGCVDDNLPLLYVISTTTADEEIEDYLEPGHQVILGDILLYDTTIHTTRMSSIQQTIDVIMGSDAFLLLICNLMSYACEKVMLNQGAATLADWYAMHTHTTSTRETRICDHITESYDAEGTQLLENILHYGRTLMRAYIDGDNHQLDLIHLQHCQSN